MIIRYAYHSKIIPALEYESHDIVKKKNKYTVPTSTLPIFIIRGLEHSPCICVRNLFWTLLFFYCSNKSPYMSYIFCAAGAICMFRRC